MKYNIEEEIERLKKEKESLPKKPFLPNDEILNKYEIILGNKFDREYREFIKSIGYAMCKGKDNLILSENQNSQRDLLEYTYLARCLGVQEDWIPIAEDNGDFYCLQPDGCVVFWSHDGPSDEKWENVAAWIHEAWLGED